MWWEWEVLTGSQGGYVDRPEKRYSMYRSANDPADTADRFGVDESVLVVSKEVEDTLLIPGVPAGPRKVIVLQGIDSQASCDDIDAGFGADTPQTRALLMSNAIQLAAWKATGDSSPIDLKSYSRF